MELKFTGLKQVLQKFDEHGWKGNFTRGDWKIAKGGYDLWFELYYKNQPVAQCIAGKLSSDFGLEETDKQKLLQKVLEVYGHLKVNEETTEFDSIIDLEDREEYEKETGKTWGDTEERMAEICSFYDYGFHWNEKGSIVINNGYYEGYFEDIDKEIYCFQGKNFEKDVDGVTLRHYEYESAEAMVQEWLSICKESNRDYEKNGQEKPFAWADEMAEEVPCCEKKVSLNERLAMAKEGLSEERVSEKVMKNPPLNERVALAKEGR